MATIQTIDFSRFLQNQVFTLHGLILAELETLSDDKLTDLKAAYAAAYAQFDAVLKTGGTNPYTKKLADADSEQDKAYTGLAAQNRVMLKHFDAEKADIAYQVELILKKYGNPTRLPYLQEDSVIKNLLQDLEALDAAGQSGGEGGEEERPGGLSLLAATEEAPLSKIYLREWVDRLKEKNDEFLQLYAARNVEDAAVVAGATKAAREATDGAYAAVVRRINSLVEINGDADYLTVINNVNRLIDKERAVLSLRRTTASKRKGQDSEESPGGL